MTASITSPDATWPTSSGRTACRWRVFAENVPLGCYTGATASGGPDGSGTYARKHEPAISFTGISSEPTRCAKITDFSHFSPSAARVRAHRPEHVPLDARLLDGDR